MTENRFQLESAAVIEMVEAYVLGDVWVEAVQHVVRQSVNEIHQQVVRDQHLLFLQNLGITNSRRLAVGGNVEWRRPF
jgi:hypothetical protein